MKYPVYFILLLALLAGACWKRDEKKLSPETIQTLPPIPEDGILAQYQNPKVVVYKYTGENNDPYTTYLRFFDENGIEHDTVLFSDATVTIDSLAIDTITFSHGKYPEVVFTWHSQGNHSYGPGMGGWALNVKTMSIWDLNTFKEIFYTDTYVDEWSAERQNPEDTLIDPADDLLVEEATEVATVTIDTLQKIITLEVEHKYHDSLAWSQETYRYKNGFFVSDEEATGIDASQYPLP